MVLVAAGLIIVSLLWDLVFPINKKLWSSSFVCFAGGISLLLFAIFYLVIDVWNYKKWTTFFVVIGMNPITIYLALRFIDFKFTTNFFFGALISLFPDKWSPILFGIAYVILGWLFLYWLNKKKIFFKI